MIVVKRAVFSFSLSLDGIITLLFVTQWSGFSIICLVSTVHTQSDDHIRNVR